MARLNFDAREVDPAVGFEPIPAGDYLAVMTESETKPTKTGSGRYLELTFQVIEGAHKGRLLWARLNLENPSAMAVKIARAELSAVCRAVNVLQPRDSVELHNLPLIVKVGLTTRDDSGEPTNVIRGYATPRSNAPAEPAVAGSAPPWQR